MKWPKIIAPYHCAILPLISKNNKSNLEKANKIYEILKSKKIDTIIDDTEESLPSKMKKFNLIGIPYQIILGKSSDDNLLEFVIVGEDSKRLDIDKISEIINKDSLN